MGNGKKVPIPHFLSLNLWLSVPSHPQEDEVLTDFPLIICDSSKLTK
ncbi:hypothetical protein NIES4103_36600 [Nostoc sp. NIES-4103]|nr:hypothetical protein NIES4103_36600 [Nostoc sp. NIES-4103]